MEGREKRVLGEGRRARGRGTLKREGREYQHFVLYILSTALDVSSYCPTDAAATHLLQ